MHTSTHTCSALRAGLLALMAAALLGCQTTAPGHNTDLSTVTACSRLDEPAQWLDIEVFVGTAPRLNGYQSRELCDMLQTASALLQQHNHSVGFRLLPLPPRSPSYNLITAGNAQPVPATNHLRLVVADDIDLCGPTTGNIRGCAWPLGHRVIALKAKGFWDAASDALIVAHEMGHVARLPHPDFNGASPTHPQRLMTFAPSEQSRQLTPQEASAFATRLQASNSEDDSRAWLLAQAAPTAQDKPSGNTIGITLDILGLLQSLRQQEAALDDEPMSPVAIALVPTYLRLGEQHGVRLERLAHLSDSELLGLAPQLNTGEPIASRVNTIAAMGMLGGPQTQQYLANWAVGLDASDPEAGRLQRRAFSALGLGQLHRPQSATRAFLEAASQASSACLSRQPVSFDCQSTNDTLRQSLAVAERHNDSVQQRAQLAQTLGLGWFARVINGGATAR